MFSHYSPIAAAFLRAVFTQSTTAKLFAVELCALHSFELPQNLNDCSNFDGSLSSVQLSALAFAANPSPATANSWLATSSAFTARLYAATVNVSTVRGTLSQSADLPERIAVPLREACSTSLQWQTSPAIGKNPASLAEFASVRHHDAYHDNPTKFEQVFKKRTPLPKQPGFTPCTFPRLSLPKRA